jgi:hypothetical protein
MYGHRINSCFGKIHDATHPQKIEIVHKAKLNITDQAIEISEPLQHHQVVRGGARDPATEAHRSVTPEIPTIQHQPLRFPYQSAGNI